MRFNNRDLKHSFGVGDTTLWLSHQTDPFRRSPPWSIWHSLGALPHHLARSMNSPSLWIVRVPRGVLSKGETSLWSMNEPKEYYYTSGSMLFIKKPSPWWENKWVEQNTGRWNHLRALARFGSLAELERISVFKQSKDASWGSYCFFFFDVWGSGEKKKSLQWSRMQSLAW